MSARIVMLGPPGAGKGTQAELLAERLGVPAISTGDIFRANVSGETDLGRVARSYMDAGDYVPDGVTNAMVRDRLKEPDATEGFILDGYPRTVEQVAALDEMLAENARALDHVLEVVADDEEVVGRILRRATTHGRGDDNEHVVRRRLEVYAAQTRPLARIYADRGILVRVDGLGSVDEVADRIAAALV